MIPPVFVIFYLLFWAGGLAGIWAVGPGMRAEAVIAFVGANLLVALIYGTFARN